jgi:hypothetical protein
MRAGVEAEEVVQAKRSSEEDGAVTGLAGEKVEALQGWAVLKG